MPKRTIPKYEGKLNTPLSLLPEVAGPGLQSVTEILEHGKGELTERLWLLLRHYGISFDDPEHWYKLALALASEHVPGLRVERRGADLTWNFQKERQLYDDIEAKIREGRTKSKSVNKSARWACRVLAKKEPYSSISADNEGARANSLYTRYEKCKSTFAAIDEEKVGGKLRRPTPVREMDRDATLAPSTATAADALIRPLAEQSEKDEYEKLGILLSKPMQTKPGAVGHRVEGKEARNQFIAAGQKFHVISDPTERAVCCEYIIRHRDQLYAVIDDPGGFRGHFMIPINQCVAHLDDDDPQR